VSSSFGRFLTITTFGESHGPAVGVILDGCPPGIAVTPEVVQRDLDRRRPGQSAITTQRKEPDKVEILSGVFEGVTTGASIALVVRSVDARPADYSNLKDLFRPGHADYTYWMKYGVRDYRGSGRSSGRETVGRVAAGAIARVILDGIGARVQAYTVQVGGIVAVRRDLAVAEQNSVRCPDPDAAAEMERAILAAREAGDSLGGVVEIRAEEVPAGLGDPVMDKLEAACRKGGAVFHATGIDPDLVSDRVVPALTGMCTDISSLTLQENWDSTYTAAELLGMCGFGMPPREAPLPRLNSDFGHSTEIDCYHGGDVCDREIITCNEAAVGEFFIEPLKAIFGV